MGILQFDAVDDLLKWATLAASLQNTPTGAWTILHGVRHNSLTGFQAYGYLLSGTGNGTVRLGLSKDTSNDLKQDFSFGRIFSTMDPVVNQDTLNVIAKPTGTTTANASKKVGSAGAWSHQAASGTQGNDLAAVQLQIGAWQGASDRLNGWKSVMAIWNVELSQAQRIACGANWRTSDIWNAHATKPLFLMEFNVAAGSLVNLGSAAISGSAHVGTTLDAAQTFGGWNFDGVGGIAVPDDKFFAFI